MTPSKANVLRMGLAPHPKNITNDPKLYTQQKIGIPKMNSFGRSVGVG
jgi:hypothetical protein